MRQSNSVNSGQEKSLARARYASRQIDKFIKWSVNQRGYLKYKELVEIQDRYNIKVHG